MDRLNHHSFMLNLFFCSFTSKPKEQQNGIWDLLKKRDRNTHLFYLICLFDIVVASSKAPAILACLSKLDINEPEKREKYCLGKLQFISLSANRRCFFFLSEKGEADLSGKKGKSLLELHYDEHQ